MTLPSSGWSGVRAHKLPVVGSLLYRWACFLLMVAMALWAEARPAPSLPDAVLSQLPYVEWVDRYNFVLWVFAYIPVAIWLLFRDAPRFVRYMVSAGMLAILRGLCIMATGLGPVRGADVNAGMSAEARWHALWEIASPIGVFVRQSAHVYLTKDLFFSGHTSTTLLLLLYVWREKPLRWLMLAGHLLVVASIFLSHLHYTIDVIGAYGLTFGLFVLRERKLSDILS